MKKDFLVPRVARYDAPLDYDVPEPYLAPEQTKKVILSDDGKTLVEVSELVEVDVRKNLSQYKPEDFKLQNLVALGLVDQLKTSSYVGNVDPSVCDYLEQFTDITPEQLQSVRDRVNLDTIKFNEQGASSADS